MDLSNPKQRLGVVWVELEAIGECLKGFVVFLHVDEHVADLEVRLECLIQLVGQFVRFQGLVMHTDHAVHVAEVVQGRVVLRIDRNRTQIENDCLIVLLLIAQCIGAIVDAVDVLWIQSRCFFELLNRSLIVAQGVIGVAHLVEDLCISVVDFNVERVVLETSFVVIELVVSIAQPQEGLVFIRFDL